MQEELVGMTKSYGISKDMFRRLNNGSRMSREVHVRFCEGPGVKFPRSTHPYVPTDEGWLYVAGHKDLYAGNIVGYAMGERLTRNLISQSLLRAVATKRPAQGLIHHSDRGSQYCSHEYRTILDRFGLTASMSRKGNCYDNAPMESFWGTLKQELVHHRRYRTRREAIRDITEYIEIFYNRQRRQARLGFLSPAAYEQRYYAGMLAA
jgi:putative transposase